MNILTKPGKEFEKLILHHCVVPIFITHSVPFTYHNANMIWFLPALRKRSKEKEKKKKQ